MTKSMIDRATLAVVEIWQNSGNDPGAVLDCGAVARAVIQAMHDPTDAMLQDGAVEMREDLPDKIKAANCWWAMIDAALIYPAGSADRVGVPRAVE